MAPRNHTQHQHQPRPARTGDRPCQASGRGRHRSPPLHAGETDALLAVFDGMSASSRALRYLTGLPRLPSQMLSVLTAVDGDLHVPWLASVDGTPAGIGRYVRVPGCPTSAELAFEVVDEQHGRGLATLLLEPPALDRSAVLRLACARGSSAGSGPDRLRNSRRRLRA